MSDNLQPSAIESPKDAAAAASLLLRELASLVGAGDGTADRIFFPTGIQLIELHVKVAAIDISFTVSGAPKGAAAVGEYSQAKEVQSKEADTGFKLLPQLSGHGYYPTAAADRQYGTPNTIQAILDVGDTVQLNQPTKPFGVNDLSFSDGSQMPPHQGHVNGRNVDIRPMRKDQQQAGVNINDPQYDRDATKIIIDSFLAHANVDFILFNDATIPGVRPAANHDDHFHVSMKS